MAIKTETKTIYQCDRCGHEQERPFADHAEADVLTVGYDALRNGASRQDAYLWCGDCTQSFTEWKKGGK